MKRSEIEAGKRYAAKVNYTEGVLVDVLEVGVERRYGYRNDTRNDGVRVRVAEPYSSWGREQPAGDEKTIATRDVQHEWTDEHQQRRDARTAAAKRDRERADAIEDALTARGIAARVDATGYVRLSPDAAEKLLELEAVTTQ